MSKEYESVEDIANEYKVNSTRLLEQLQKENIRLNKVTDEVTLKQYKEVCRVAKSLVQVQGVERSEYEKLLEWKFFGTIFDPVTKEYKVTTVNITYDKLKELNAKFFEGTTNPSTCAIRFHKELSKHNFLKEDKLDSYFRNKK